MTNLQDRIYAGDNFGRVLRLIKADLLESPISTRAPFYTGWLLQRHADIEQDYQRMVDFMGRGYEDADRNALCKSLFQRLFMLAGDLYLCRLADKNASYVKASAAAKLLPSDISQLIEQLEAYSLELVTLPLTDETHQTEKLRSAYKSHAQLADNFFSWLLASPGWNDFMARNFCEKLLSPSVDNNDALLAVSALTLSLLTIFDENKWLLLVRIWREAESVTLSQRAFVGWVLTLPKNVAGKIGRDGLFNRVSDEIERILDSDDARNQLLDLQMQIFQCFSAESDGRQMQEEIMPELIRNSDVVVRNGKLVEREDDPMDDILPHSEATDKAQKMEESIQKLNDLQKSGADIYFHGFRQMKRFPFFSTLSNWFLPFYIDHPELQSVDELSKRLLQTLISQQQFCDSDKYSIALVFKQMGTRLGVLKDMADASSNFSVSAVQPDAAMARRHYVQDLYRFFSVCAYRTDFPNPFSDLQRSFFFISQSLPVESLAVEAEQLALYFYKRKRYKEIIALYQRLGSYATPLVMQLAAASMQRVGQNQEAFRLASTLLEEAPDMSFLLSCHAAAAKALNRWSDAVRSYSKLLEGIKYRTSVALDLAFCLIRSGRPSESLPHLQRVNYEHPDNLRALSMLVEAYLSVGSIDDAYWLTSSLSLPKQNDDMAPTVLEYCRQLSVRYIYILVARGKMQQAVDVLHQSFEEYFKSDADQLQQTLIADRGLLEQMELSPYSVDLVVSLATN